VFVDTSKAALKAIINNPYGLCLKVNSKELLEALGITPDSASRSVLIESGKKLLRQGAAMLVVTLGAGGALVVTTAGVWQVTPPPVSVTSTVGSGDCMLAGLVVGQLRGYTIPEAVAFGVACGTANALSDLPGCFEQQQVEQLRQQIKIVQVFNDKKA
jgi:fructose-1-phosphate kinase PfkB-like protein